MTAQFIETAWYNTPCLPLFQHLKSQAPFINVHQLNKDCATDTIFANCKAHNESTFAQIYLGVNSQLVSLEDIKSKSQMTCDLLKFIRSWRFLHFLWYGMAKEKDISTVYDILRSVLAPKHFSKPYNKHQNTTKGKLFYVKSGKCIVIHCTGTPAKW